MHTVKPNQLACESAGASPWTCIVSQASHIYLCFQWEEREEERNTYGHSGQLSVPLEICLVASGHMHDVQIRISFIVLGIAVLFCG